MGGLFLFLTIVRGYTVLIRFLSLSYRRVQPVSGCSIAVAGHSCFLRQMTTQELMRETVA